MLYLGIPYRHQHVCMRLCLLNAPLTQVHPFIGKVIVFDMKIYVIVCNFNSTYSIAEKYNLVIELYLRGPLTHSAIVYYIS